MRVAMEIVLCGLLINTRQKLSDKVNVIIFRVRGFEVGAVN